MAFAVPQPRFKQRLSRIVIRLISIDIRPIIDNNDRDPKAVGVLKKYRFAYFVAIAARFEDFGQLPGEFQPRNGSAPVRARRSIRQRVRFSFERKAAEPNGSFAAEYRGTMRSLDLTMNTSGCAWCTLEPPPDILHIPPPPFPAILQQTSDFYPHTDLLSFPPHLNDSPCKHFCDRRSEGVQYIEMPQQGTVFDDTWLLVLISSCVGVIFIGVVLATLLLKCKFNRSSKSGVISIPNATASMQSKNGRIQNEAVRYPCATDAMQDSRVMWAALTPRGTTRHYLEEHTYETIGGGQFHKRTCSTTPTEHTYADPPAPTPIQNRLKDDKAFDNTAFVDYEEPSLIKTDYYQLNDVLEPNDPGMQRASRPRVSSPTRIEHPNLPPLNLHPHKRSSRKGSTATPQASDTLLRSSIASSTYIPTI